MRLKDTNWKNHYNIVLEEVNTCPNLFHYFAYYKIEQPPCSSNRSLVHILLLERSLWINS
jgi:hypothetical protein